MSSRSKEDPGHQAALPRDDCQEHEEVLHIRGPGSGRQEREEKVPSQQLPVHHEGEAVHLHDADEAGRGLEPDPVQPGGLHQESLRDQLRGDAPGPDPRQLSDPTCLFL